MEFIAFIVTVLVGFVAESLLGNWLNWPGAAAAAAFILRALQRKEAPAETQSDAQSPGGCPGGQEK